MEEKMKIGGNIRKWRNLKGIKQKDLASALKISEAAMSNLENNLTDITLGQIESLTRLLNISMDQLFTDPQDSIGPVGEYRPVAPQTETVRERDLVYAVIRSMEMKDQQLRDIVDNVLQTMNKMTGSLRPGG